MSEKCDNCFTYIGEKVYHNHKIVLFSERDQIAALQNTVYYA